MTLRDGERPVEQVIDVGKNFKWRAAALAGTESGTLYRHASQYLGGAVGQSRQGMPQHLAFWIRAHVILREISVLQPPFSKVGAYGA